MTSSMPARRSGIFRALGRSAGGEFGACRTLPSPGLFLSRYKRRGNHPGLRSLILSPHIRRGAPRASRRARRTRRMERHHRLDARRRPRRVPRQSPQRTHAECRAAPRGCHARYPKTAPALYRQPPSTRVLSRVGIVRRGITRAAAPRAPTVFRVGQSFRWRCGARVPLHAPTVCASKQGGGGQRRSTLQTAVGTRSTHPPTWHILRDCSGEEAARVQVLLSGAAGGALARFIRDRFRIGRHGSRDQPPGPASAGAVLSVRQLPSNHLECRERR